MSEHRITLEWKRESEDFSYESYNRNHILVFEGGVRVPASAAPAYRGNPAHVNPEEAFVAALASCHMLTFLAMAAKKRFVVDRYSDHAVGLLEIHQNKKLAITRAILRPQVIFGGPSLPTQEQIHAFHEQAQSECFIANSVTTDVTVEAE
ncbi:MAG: OsmC family protein [Nitrospirales bacterium]|nr:OsmC family protein [Nitrospirales bacterium]